MERRLFNSVRFHSGLATVLLVITLLSLLGLYVFFEKISLILMLMLMGALGGLTNNYLRLRSIPLDESQFIDSTSNRMAILQIYVSPIVAGVFALVLYGMFAAGILQGALFPEFKGLDDPYKSFNEMFRSLEPKSQMDAAKALIWGFIAGFSERLVPNIIDRIVVEAERSGKKPKE